MKPNFEDLPYNVREELLWSWDLEYDSYEDSKEQMISRILNNYPTFQDERQVKLWYDNTTTETLTHYLEHRINQLLNANQEIHNIRKLIQSLKQ